jgi:hypothetical protein
MFLILIKISLWVVRIWEFEGAIGVLNNDPFSFLRSNGCIRGCMSTVFVGLESN